MISLDFAIYFKTRTDLGLQLDRKNNYLMQ